MQICCWWHRRWKVSENWIYLNCDEIKFKTCHVFLAKEERMNEWVREIFMYASENFCCAMSFFFFFGYNFFPFQLALRRLIHPQKSAWVCSAEGWWNFFTFVLSSQLIMQHILDVYRRFLLLLSFWILCEFVPDGNARFALFLRKSPNKKFCNCMKLIWGSRGLITCSSSPICRMWHIELIKLLPPGGRQALKVTTMRMKVTSEDSLASLMCALSWCSSSSWILIMNDVAVIVSCASCQHFVCVCFTQNEKLNNLQFKAHYTYFLDSFTGNECAARSAFEYEI